MSSAGLLSLPPELMLLLLGHLHNIEDLINTSLTCSQLTNCMAKVTPKVILRLAAAQTKVFFRPSPHFLVTATARELGNWARKSDANEKELALRLEEGIDGLLELALEHCGLTMERIRELQLLRYSLINPVTNIIDQCVGLQWAKTPGFWDTVDDAITLSADPPVTLFHLATYGELFAPDFETILNQDSNSRRLSVDTRLEFIKYCLPDCSFLANGYSQLFIGTDPAEDQRLQIRTTGPYTVVPPRSPLFSTHNHNIALTWLIRSSRFRPLYKDLRAKAGVPEFQKDFDDGWWFEEGVNQNWRQRLWECIMVCQGLEGLKMLITKEQLHWLSKIREWRDKITNLDREPPLVKVGQQATLEYPYLLGDLRVCAYRFANDRRRRR
ncbi:hypothetical protein GQX73_g9221 [Xylaria multiplex]|uniref:F-box domain-containing protein n=1 Tax=Xylaria multiplex TaxID=323545 RepID=A0A7C8IIK2_9PEZI|nr:hypothetical protein GQX73_g9221 [Xylaria multiplex]